MSTVVIPIPANFQWPPGTAAPTLSQATQTSDVATNALTVKSQAPFATATANNRYAAALVFDVPGPTNGGTFLPASTGIGTFDIDFAESPVFRYGFFAATSYGLYLGASAAAASATNYTIVKETGDTIFNDSAALIFAIGGVLQFQLNTNQLYPQTDNSKALGLASFRWSNVATVSLLTSSMQVAQVSKGTTYAVDSGASPDFLVLLTGNAFTATLPVPTAGRVLKFKDAAGNASTQNKTIAPHAAETIDGAASYVLTLNKACVELTSDGTNWFVTGEYNGTVI
jgi:hypothetical protein